MTCQKFATFLGFPRAKHPSKNSLAFSSLNNGYLGTFILGNDGGIWAELLADRKFFHPIEEKHGAPSSSPLTKSPWRASSAEDADVTSPRLPSKALVRGGRVVAFRFPCPTNSSVAEPTTLGGGGRVLPEQWQEPRSDPKAPKAKSSASLKEKLAVAEEDDGIDGSSSSSSRHRSISRSGSRHGYG
jgi:hypothetical protein